MLLSVCSRLAVLLVLFLAASRTCCCLQYMCWLSLVVGALLERLWIQWFWVAKIQALDPAHR